MPSIRDIAFIGCRLLALYVLVSSVQAIVFNSWFLLQMFRSQEQWNLRDKVFEWASHSLPMIALLIMVAFLWWRADWIAGRVTSGVEGMPAEDSGGWSRHRALSVAVAVLGLWVLVGHLPTLVSYLFLILTHDAYGARGSMFSPVSAQGLVSTVIATGLGLICILSAQAIANFFGRLRRW